MHTVTILGDAPIGVAEILPRIPWRLGEKLNNGAILLEKQVVRKYEFRYDVVVLALNPGAVEPFVTWHRVITSNSRRASGLYEYLDTCAHGHYHRDLDKAVEEFNRRWQIVSSLLNPEDGEDI